MFDGHAEETEREEDEALRLSPRDPRAWIWMNRSGAAKLHLDANEDAVIRLRRAGLNPNFPVMHFALAGALANLGTMEEARAETHAGLALDPTCTVGSFRLGAESDNPVFVKQHERSADIMRKAGMPAG